MMSSRQWRKNSDGKWSSIDPVIERQKERARQREQKVKEEKAKKES